MLAAWQKNLVEGGASSQNQWEAGGPKLWKWIRRKGLLELERKVYILL